MNNNYKNIEKLLKREIRWWVKKNYGANEADNPSWSIKVLARDLSSPLIINKIYDEIRRESLLADCEDVANENDIELTEEEKEKVVQEFLNGGFYCEDHTEDWLYCVELVKGERNE